MGELSILSGNNVRDLLTGREREVMAVVSGAYQLHAQGQTVVPHSSFLRLPDSEKDRIIALPAYIGGDEAVAGIKWIASIPANTGRGMERASAVVILNSRVTGRPEVVMEGSIISAQRTAASAAVAAKVLCDVAPDCIGIVGCGRINREITKFLRVLWPTSNRFACYDLSDSRRSTFQEQVRHMVPDAEFEAVDTLQELLARCPLISLATTAVEPYLDDLSACRGGTVILNVSLRDLAPEAILACDNVVDDIDHVCRAGTSIELAANAIGNRNFVRCTIGEILLGAPSRLATSETISVFSPFGLGILDLAVGKYVSDLAASEQLVTRVPSFFPSSCDQPSV